MIVCDTDDVCSFCLDNVEDKSTYYRPPCGHIFCYMCMDQEKLLSTCTRCNQGFEVAEPVLVRVALKID